AESARGRDGQPDLHLGAPGAAHSGPHRDRSASGRRGPRRWDDGHRGGRAGVWPREARAGCRSPLIAPSRASELAEEIAGPTKSSLLHSSAVRSAEFAWAMAARAAAVSASGFRSTKSWIAPR